VYAAIAVGASVAGGLASTSVARMTNAVAGTTTGDHATNPIAPARIAASGKTATAALPLLPNTRMWIEPKPRV